MLSLIGIGALGNMLSPAANHLNNLQDKVRFIRIYDRNPEDISKEARRSAWLAHGAELVTTYEDLISQADFDAIVICAGKNGDDVVIIGRIISLIDQFFPVDKRPFILHLSTVSIDFVTSAYEAAATKGISYVNYPLTGGEKGAQTASMLILASGNKPLFERLLPLLNCLGRPKYFDQEITTAAKVKLIGHLMVFNGLVGMTSAVALQAKSMNIEKLPPLELFDFLNQGAGGTRQWDVALRQAINDDFSSGFLLTHAVVDAIYTADLLLHYQMPSMMIYPILQLATAFSYLIKTYPQKLATQVLLKAVLEHSNELENFIALYQQTDPALYLEKCIQSLPEKLQATVKLKIEINDFLNI